MPENAPKTLVSWSSGKDSAWALHVLRQSREFSVIGLLATLNSAFDRVAMHSTRRTVLEAQAAAAGLRLHPVPLPWPCPNAAYEEAMQAAVDGAVQAGITHMAFGDLFLEDVRRYREDRLQGTGITPVFPLWERNTGELAEEMIAGGLRASIVCLDPAKLPRSFAGRRFDAALLRDLPAGVDPCGERGEFHTCVFGGPMFSAEVPVRSGEVIERDGFVFADLELAPGS